MAIEIRPVRPADVARIGAMIVAIQREEFEIPITLEQQPDLSDIEGFYRARGGDFWIAEAPAGAVVGSIAAIPFGDRDVMLRKMFVHRDWRGAKHRVAQRLLESLIDWAEGRSLRRVWLGTTEKFRAAHRFYEKNGFELVERETIPMGFLFMPVDTRFYRRVLA